ncbi:MAG: flippase-like domain-containing protein [Phycisphaerae bacterium]|nr:flippase-like domain-containing protein [Phycisphaerae bacterium]
MAPRTRQRIFNVLRITLCAAALWIVVQGVTLNDRVHLVGGGEQAGIVLDDSGPIRVRVAPEEVVAIPLEDVARDEQGDLRITYGLRTAVRDMNGWLFLLAVGIYFPIIFLQAWRFQWVLRAQDIGLRYWQAVKLSIAGNFLNFATPLGSNAGDVFKAYFLSLHTDRKTEAVTTVFLDRVIGLATLLSVVAVITLVSPSDSRLAIVRPYLLFAVGLGIVLIFAYFSPPLRRWVVPRRWIQRLPAYDHLQRIDRSAHKLAGHKPILIGAVVLTAILQAMAVTAYFTVAKSLGMRGGLPEFPEYYTYFSTGVLVQSLPGPPQGLGTVELTFKFFLAPFGSPAQIVCVAFAIRLMVLLCALPGLFVALTGSYRPSQAEGDNTQGAPATTAAAPTSPAQSSNPESAVVARG